MTYFQLIRLSYKKFLRRPNLSRRLVFKILSILGYLFFAVYMIILVFLMYYGVQKKFPNADVFQKANTYIFVYFFVVFYVMMYLNFDSMQVKPLMLLPVKKTKIVKFQLLKIIFHPVNFIFLTMIIIAAGLFYADGYALSGLMAWAFSILALTLLIELLLFFSSRNLLFNIIISLSIFIIVYKIQWLSQHLQFIGAFFTRTYHQPYWLIMPVIFLIASILILYYYFLKRFYLDDAIKAHQKQKVRDINLIWTEKYGVIGSLIRNDIRLIWRNIRPKQGLIGFIIFYIMAFVFMSKIGTELKQPEFNKILFLMMLSGYFVMQFGNFIPAWDSEYYPFLMTQNFTYRQYIEAKWWLLSSSVLVSLVLTLPFFLLGWQVYILILAMAVFTIGFNIPIILYAGIYRTTPIKLNEKVKAFQSRDSFKMKTFMLAILRLFLPIVVYLLLDHYFGFIYGIGFFVCLGLGGLIFRKKLLDYISKLYQTRKYITLNAFKQAS